MRACFDPHALEVLMSCPETHELLVVALENGMTVIAELPERIQSVAHMRQRRGEDRDAFIQRVAAIGENDAHFCKRATKVALQRSGFLTELDADEVADWQVEEMLRMPGRSWAC